MTNSREKSRLGSPDCDSLGSKDETMLETDNLGKFVIIPIHIARQPRCWKIKDMLAIYIEDFQQDDRGWHTRTIFDELWILTFGFDSVLILHDTIALYRLDWIVAPLVKYSPTLVHVFYVSYDDTVIEATPKNDNPNTQPKLTCLLV